MGCDHEVDDAAGMLNSCHRRLLVSRGFAMMMMFPEAQRKAQEEIDKVVGQGRLPDFDDRENLPYLQATVYEAMR